MTLEQLMAFTVTSDHARQEQVWELRLARYNKEPYAIRRQLTEGAVRASDRRARFVGVDAYEAAGGVVMRDLFQHDDGGWLQDPALLDRLVAEKLQRRGGDTARRRLEMDRGRGGLPLWPLRRSAAPHWRDRANSPRTSGRLRRPQGRERSAGRTICRSRRTARRNRPAAWRNRKRACAFENRPVPTIRPKSSEPAPLSASITKVRCVSSAASFGRRTKHRSNRLKPAEKLHRRPELTY